MHVLLWTFDNTYLCILLVIPWFSNQSIHQLTSGKPSSLTILQFGLDSVTAKSQTSRRTVWVFLKSDQLDKKTFAETDEHHTKLFISV